MLGFYPLTHPLLIVADLLSIVSWLILANVIVSWLVILRIGRISRYDPWVRTLFRITDPLLAPFRKIVPPSKLQGIDISPFLAIIVIQIVQGLLVSAAVASLR